jgi:hypothetical protein
MVRPSDLMIKNHFFKILTEKSTKIKYFSLFNWKKWSISINHVPNICLDIYQFPVTIFGTNIYMNIIKYTYILEGQN